MSTPEVEFTSLPMSVLARGERRLEGENYLTGGFGLRVQLESTFDIDRLGTLADIWQPNRLKATLVGPTDGLPFYTATQIFDIRPQPRKWIAPSKIRDSESLFVEPGWLMVTRSGSVGDALVAFTPHLGSVISDDLLRVRVREPRNSGYIYAFLRSRFGRTILRSTKYGSIVKHLEPEHLTDVPVPQVDSSLIDDLNERVGRVFDLRKQAFALTLEAERIYTAQFSAVDSGQEEDTGYALAASQMFGTRRRLDGHYYNPAARAVLRTLANSGTATEPLAAVASVFGVPRFKHVYQETGIPYLDSEDLFKLNPEITKYIPEVTKTDADKYYVQRGWVLMACSGQLYGLNGSVVLADTWHEKKIISNHVLRILPKDIRPGYLAMTLGHPELGAPLVLRTAFGSEIPEIPPDALLDIPVPRLGQVEDEIADRMETAAAKRRKADQIEDAAVLKVEDALGAPLAAQPPEFEAFETLASKLFKVPKSEVSG